jgi:hypothetical protein
LFGKVSIPAWLNLSDTQRLILAFHEYLGIMKLETGTYFISNRLKAILKPGEMDNSLYSFIGSEDLGNGRRNLLVIEQLSDDRLLVVKSTTNTRCPVPRSLTGFRGANPT